MTDPRRYAPKPNLLEGRVVLVTGASRGIGRIAAMSFAAHGATVVLHGRDQGALESVYDEIEAAGHPEPAAVPLDFLRATARDYEELAHAIETRLGRLDGILHNASHLEKLSALQHQSLDEWAQTLRVNLIAPATVNRACSRLLMASPDASVVFTSETHGHGPAAYWGAYAVSKAGLEALMKIQAAEWSDAPNLRANAVIPGPVASPSRAKSHPGEVAQSMRKPESLMPTYLYLMGPDSRGVTAEAFEC